MAKKQLKDCTYIFLDSGVVIDLMKIDLSKSPPDVVERVNWVRRFFASLEDKNVYGNMRKVYQISSISLAEIFHLDNQQGNTVQAVAAGLNAENLEIVVFDEFTAAFHNKEFYNILSNKAIDELKKTVNYPVSQHASIRDRIRRDIMIAASAKLYESDIVLTTYGYQYGYLRL